MPHPFIVVPQEDVAFIVRFLRVRHPEDCFRVVDHIRLPVTRIERVEPGTPGYAPGRTAYAV